VLFGKSLENKQRFIIYIYCPEGRKNYGASSSIYLHIQIWAMIYLNWLEAKESREESRNVRERFGTRNKRGKY
jgi:hypothetical protein